ncbi:hypothetical protein DUNSADRAFT_6427 [Dunaliella salina]|uniref:Protein kinase domain-containing protein n=1 Tax=Dunaliella salina TaxID=3046 RepID=A0ABQ7H6U5_DUNSA|nr:hypothetical protein DUNSADRAFT_6427 [Dunaliella salina]|eukprot:KAF5842577.1 hypothetical protein DUNSADRAFT_6427 [Dunaliella salina]
MWIAIVHCRSPEKLALGTGARQVTRAADVWALAISILQVAINDPTLPYSSGYTMEDMNKQLNINKEAPEVRMLPELPGLQLLLQRCLALDQIHALVQQRLWRSPSVCALVSWLMCKMLWPAVLTLCMAA